MAASTMTMVPPSIPHLTLLGNLPEIRANRLAFLQRVSRQCGDMGVYRLGSRTFMLVNTPELAHQILVTRAEDVEKGRRLRNSPVLGNGLVTSLNAFHKQQRKLVAPAFQPRRLAAYGDTMASYAERWQGEWTSGATVDIATQMLRLTLGITGKTLFDTELFGEASELDQALATARSWTAAQINSFLPIPRSWPTASNRRFNAARARLDATIYRIIAERRADGKDHGDVLSVLLAARDAGDGTFMTDEQVRDEVMTLFVAGHETIANALTWTWHLLTQYPGVYERLRSECDRVLEGRAPAFADLSRLPYALQVLKEALRLYPPIPSVTRYAVRQVEVGGHTFPAGTTFQVSPYTMHRRPNLFPYPELFDPERFAPKAEAQLPRYAYLPFVAGPRNCIGAQFALTEGQTVLATLVQRVTFNHVPGQLIEPEALISLRPKQGIQMTIWRRE